MPNRFQLVCPSHAAIFTCHTSRPGSFAVSHGLFCLYRHSFDTVRRGHVLNLFLHCISRRTRMISKVLLPTSRWKTQRRSRGFDAATIFGFIQMSNLCFD